ncbi:hypothetical protein FOMPIDRAFT_1063481 [Fomitopsis schrenkii]|uniref:DUF6533 domain-containing protein n=1 Tax=Fomitopsis schrenkii TaxID=2126942 RepID=S8DQR4_FOMSC|nr:hypothetical protein FOMPIDRAFT_1063481 [Fomitopsis schrenkii]
MNNTTSIQAQDAEAYQAALTVSYSYFAALCLYCFDVMITFDQQIDFLCRRRLSLKTVLFLLVRILGVCLLVILPASALTPTCERLVFLVATLRAYALSRGNSWVAAAIPTLFLIEIFANIFNSSTMHREDSPAYLGGCYWSNGANTVAVNELAIAGLAATLVAHLLTLIVTWRSTFSTIKLSNICEERSGIGAMLLRDGTLFFGTILVVDIVTIILANSSTYTGFTGFNITLVTILLSRFFMDLQESSDARDSTEHTVSDIFFDVRRSFGSSVAFGEDEPRCHSPEDPWVEQNQTSQDMQLEAFVSP